MMMTVMTLVGVVGRSGSEMDAWKRDRREKTVRNVASIRENEGKFRTCTSLDCDRLDSSCANSAATTQSRRRECQTGRRMRRRRPSTARGETAGKSKEKYQKK